MPELPDIEAYLFALRERVVGQPLERARLLSPFVLRTFEPKLDVLEGREVLEMRRIGKRIVFGFPDAHFMVVHLMIAGRLRWKKAGSTPGRKLGLAAFDFPAGTLVFTEASKKKRASIHVVRGEEALADHDPGGIDPLAADAEAFRAALVRKNHTVKRALTDPRILSGIGNSYSDEILHRAKLSPLKWTQKLSDEEHARLRDATVGILDEWTTRLREELGGDFPDKVTAFRPEMAVHGKFKEPCPVCGAKVQRIAYADRETNYCAGCQTGGKLLADRSLSRLLKGDWPKRIEDLE